MWLSLAGKPVPCESCTESYTEGIAGRDSISLLQIIAAAKKRGQEKAKLTKSLIVLDVKPWDDTTGDKQNRPARAGQQCAGHYLPVPTPP